MVELFNLCSHTQSHLHVDYAVGREQYSQTNRNIVISAIKVYKVPNHKRKESKVALIVHKTVNVFQGQQNSCCISATIQTLLCSGLAQIYSMDFFIGMYS